MNEDDPACRVRKWDYTDFYIFPYIVPNIFFFSMAEFPYAYLALNLNFFGMNLPGKLILATLAPTPLKILSHLLPTKPVPIFLTACPRYSKIFCCENKNDDNICPILNLMGGDAEFNTGSGSA